MPQGCCALKEEIGQLRSDVPFWQGLFEDKYTFSIIVLHVFTQESQNFDVAV